MSGVELATSFAEYFLQQGFHVELVFLIVPALVYLVLLAVTIAVVGFLTASLPFVEYLNACHVGAPILADRYVACG